jgi:hypothetical protein
MFALCGVGLIVGGVFSADPALGFPLGATGDDVGRRHNPPPCAHERIGKCARLR